MYITPYETPLNAAATLPAVLLSTARPHLTGGHAQLRRYAVAAEKPLGKLGQYSNQSSSQWNWPNRTADSILDASYVRIFMDDAYLRYYNKTSGSDDVVAADSSYKNRLVLSPHLSGRGWAKNTSSYPRLADLYDRDVQVGDVVYVRGTDGVDTDELWSYVAELLPTKSAAVIASATADSDNVADQSLTKSVSQTAGAANYVEISSSSDVDATTYDGYASGCINETYTVVVIQGSTGGDATTARLSVTSASGLDDVASVTPAAFSSATTIGARGLKATFTLDTGNSVDAGQPTSDFVIGQTWRITLEAAFTAAVPTSGGTYTGTKSGTYRAEVIRGGKFQLDLAAPTVNPAVTASDSGGSLPNATYSVKITYVGDTGETTISTGSATTGIVTTGSSGSLVIASPAVVTGARYWKLYVANDGATYKLQGTNRSFGVGVTLTSFNGSGSAVPGSNTAKYNNPAPPLLGVTADGMDSGTTRLTAANTAAAIGNLGVTLKVQAGLAGLRKGDVFYVNVTAPAEQAYQTIVLGHNLSQILLDATDLDVQLFIKKNIEVPKDRVESPPTTNWSVDDTYVTLASGITAYDSSWTDNGTELPLPVTKGTAYVQYRAWLQDFVNVVADSSLTTIAEVENVLGPVHPDNPLAFAVGAATPYGNGLVIRFSAVSDPTDSTAWDAVLSLLESQDGIRSLVALTDDPDILAKFSAHAVAMSGDTIGQWRNNWRTLRVTDKSVLVDSSTTIESDGTAQAKVAKATLLDDPAASGTQYTLATCTTRNAHFVTQGVRKGDKFRFLYTTDGFGNEIYTEFAVQAVVNEDTLLLQTGHSAPISTAQRFEIWRTATKDEVVDDLVLQASASGSDRDVMFWPDQATILGQTVSGYFAAAVTAVYAASIAPHQGLRNVQIPGISAVARSSSYFNVAQLDRLSAGGVFVLAQAPDGRVYCRSAKTADVSTLQTSEEMCVRSLDAIRRFLWDAIANYFGSANRTTELIAQIQADLSSRITFLKSSLTRLDRIGSLVQTGGLVSLRESATDADGLVAEFDLTGPNPLNRVTFTLPIS